MRSFTSAVLALGFAALIAGCASSSVLVGTRRPPIAPDAVKLYLSPPPKYEEIALVDASNRGSFSITDQGRMDTVIQRLKEEAAKLGANGILLQGVGDKYAGSVTSSSGTARTSNGVAYGSGIGFSAAVLQKGANGVAIFVPAD